MKEGHWVVCSRGSPRTSPYLWSDFESFSLSVHSTLLTLAIVQASNALIMLFFFFIPVMHLHWQLHQTELFSLLSSQINVISETPLLTP